MQNDTPATDPTRAEGKAVAEVFHVFLKLGLTAFGGPVAHLGYFRDEFVKRRGWLDDAGYADIVALCQFLPGPASSQTGFVIGYLRAGMPGALAAWLAFTLPSALFLTLCALAAGSFDNALGAALIHALKIVAVAVVAQAIWSMAKTLTPDAPRVGIALGALVMVMMLPGSLGQMIAIAGGGLLGLVLCKPAASASVQALPVRLSRSAGIACLALFTLLLVVPPLLIQTGAGAWAFAFDAFYRAGALVFGGGHVVLPLLETAFVGAGRLTNDLFLAGYGLAQIVPGPLFTFAAYLGAASQTGPNGWAGAMLGTVAIFLPGLLLVLGALPFWSALRNRLGARAALQGVNAAVVGLLAAAFYDPVWTSAIRAPGDFALAATGFILLVWWKLPPVAVVVAMAFAGTLYGLA